jgi:hypothetical protein
MDINKEVADKVRQAMDNKKQSILNTATSSAIAYSTFHRKLEGGGSFTMSELGRLADALDVHPSELMPASFVQESAA